MDDAGGVAASARVLSEATRTEADHAFTVVESDASGTAKAACRLVVRRIQNVDLAEDEDTIVEHGVACRRSAEDYLQWADASVAGGVPLTARARDGQAERVEYASLESGGRAQGQR